MGVLVVSGPGSSRRIFRALYLAAAEVSRVVITLMSGLDSERRLKDSHVQEEEGRGCLSKTAPPPNPGNTGNNLKSAKSAQSTHVYAL